MTSNKGGKGKKKESVDPLPCWDEEGEQGLVLARSLISLGTDELGGARAAPTLSSWDGQGWIRVHPAQWVPGQHSWVCHF